VPLTSTVEIHSSRPPFDAALFHAAREAGSNFAMPPKRARFPRTARLLRHADFERVYKQGRRHFSASMTVFYWPRPETNASADVPVATRTRMSAPHGLRVGFTVGRALGGAVERNRMKRRLREAVRLAGPLSCAGVGADVVINPKKSLLKADFADVVNEVRRGFAVIEQKLSGKAPAKINTGNTVVDYKDPEGGNRF
jgi:ribonuclease P protein component